MSTSGVDVANPFIGLHYFDEQHEDLFFGRDEQVRDLLAKLESSRFVTVIGSSGTGKSSLVRAGLIPALRRGFMTASGSNWRVLTTRPGASPICNLAQAMEGVSGRSAGAEVTLRRGPLGLVEAAVQWGLAENANLLVVVDQFEEIFRYQRETKDRQAAAEEAAAFIRLLLEASAQRLPNIFVLLTMRSEYLGACAQFRDLPERINTGLYLIPRMRRDQMEDAITGPAAIAGAKFSPPLVQKLLNDAGEDPDQLPVLQHALLRTWMNWKAEAAPSREIEFRHYDSTGGARSSLDQHAEELYAALSPAQQRTAEAIFRCLTERDPSNSDIRRPTLLAEAAAVTGVPVEEVVAVIDRFRQDGVWFLMPSAPALLSGDTLLDITHESLIRKWRRLGGSADRKGWVLIEAEDRDQYRDLVKRARRALPQKAVLADADLDDALAWRARGATSAWARRYDPSGNAFQLVLDYIERSDQADRTGRAEERLERIWGRISRVLVALFIAVFTLTSARALKSVIRDGDFAIALLFGLIGAGYAGVYFLIRAISRAVLRRILFARLVKAAGEQRRRTAKPNPMDERVLAAMSAGQFATFWRRAAASLVDLAAWVALMFPAVGVGALAGVLGWAPTSSDQSAWSVLSYMAIVHLYETRMICLPGRATVGQRALAIVVADSRGHRLSFMRANGRFFASMISYYSLIGPLMALWTKKRQALHDKIAGTYAVQLSRGDARTALQAGAFAKFPSRAFALLIDLPIYLVLYFLATGVAEGAVNLGLAQEGQWSHYAWILCSLAVFIYLYETLMICLPGQATIGQKAAWVAVTDSDGRRLTFGRASVRFFFSLVSIVTIVGPLMPLWARQRRSLQDKLTGSYVVQLGVSPPPSIPAEVATEANLVGAGSQNG